MRRTVQSCGLAELKLAIRVTLPDEAKMTDGLRQRKKASYAIKFDFSGVGPWSLVRERQGWHTSPHQVGSSGEMTAAGDASIGYM
jgi:hypothetical protein